MTGSESKINNSNSSDVTQLDEATIQKLLTEACEAKKRAYCVYSHFPVGCALLCSDGTIVKGCNVENASYGLTLCAERSAYCSAVMQGHTSFIACAVVTDLDNPAFPCGACRQFMSEFGDVSVFVGSGKATSSSTTFQCKRLSTLLPLSFGPRDLDGFVH